MLVRGMVQHQIGDDAHTAAMRLIQKPTDISHRAVIAKDPSILSHVVPVVSERRREKRKEPDAVDSQPLQIVQLLGEAGKVSDAVAVLVEEGLPRELAEHGVLVPEWIHHSPRRLYVTLSMGSFAMNSSHTPINAERRRSRLPK